MTDDQVVAIIAAILYAAADAATPNLVTGPDLEGTVQFARQILAAART